MSVYKSKHTKKANVFVIFCFFLLLVIFTLSCYGATNWSIPPHIKAPDEITRMLVPNFIEKNGTLPFGTEESVRIKLWGFSYAMQPYLPSIFAAFFMKIANLLSFNSFDFSYLLVNIFARMVSVLSLLGTVFIAIKIGKIVFSKNSTIFLFACLSGLLPQFFYLSTYFNNDIFSVFSTYLIVYAWLKGKDSGWAWKYCTLLSIALAMCLLTYYFAYAFIICSVIIFNVTMYSKKSRKKREWVKKELFIIGLVFLLAGWFFIWNYIKFHDFIGLKTVAYYGEMFGSTSPPLKPSIRMTPQKLNYSLSYMIFDKKWLSDSWTSFIGNFGELQFPLSFLNYFLYTTIISAGFLVGNIKKIYDTVKYGIDYIYISLIFCMLTPILFSLYYSFKVDYQAQGRYFMSILLPLMLLTSLGYECLSKKYKYVNHIITTVFIFLFLYVLFNTMLPNL